jgi:predicted lipid-binding transport protein (Tim44 family)
MKKFLLVVMSCMLFFAIVTPSVVDAKASRSYKSPTGSFKQTPPNSTRDGSVAKPDPNASTARTPGMAPAPNRGFFSGGGLMKGLLIGGLAGMMFGGIFGNMGFMGNILGMLVNVLGLIIIVMIIIKIVGYFIERRRTNQKRY